MKKVMDMVADANAELDCLTADDAKALLGRDGVTFVDLRDIRELKREGRIPGAFHCPRGMLEFWLDPESPYAKKEFQSGDRFVFFCGAGWRSALAAKTAQDMGLANVSHIETGFGGWRDAGGEIDKPESD